MAETKAIILRIAPELLSRIDGLTWDMHLREKQYLSRSSVLQHIIQLGCDVLERSLEETAQPTPVPTVPAHASAPVEPLAPIKPVKEPAAHLIRIADARAQYPRLSFQELAQLLYDRGIYRSKDKDGVEVPVNRGTLKKMIGRCEKLGLL